MTHPRITPYALALWTLLVPCTGPMDTALAQKKSKAELAPSRTLKQFKKVRKSYEACRKDALASLKKGKVTKKKFEVALSLCNESFPGASLYTDCKKKAIKAAARTKQTPEQGVAECKRYLVAASFDPKDPVPYFVENGQLYFAGIGLNNALPATSLAPPNFECEKLLATSKNPKDAQYFLFGNHPRVFSALADKKGADLMQALRLTGKAAAAAEGKGSKGADVSGFGRIFGDPKKAAGVVFFPSASCDFDAEPGEILAGMSAYYLLDTENSAATPYFGIAYFKKEQTAVTTQKLTNELLKVLGPGFKTYAKKDKSGPRVTFVAAAPVVETDEDQDPKNLCRQPRQHRFVGIVQGRKDEPTKPEFAVLANIRNLCDFGDKLAKKLTE